MLAITKIEISDPNEDPLPTGSLVTFDNCFLGTTQEDAENGNPIVVSWNDRMYLALPNELALVDPESNR